MSPGPKSSRKQKLFGTKSLRPRTESCYHWPYWLGMGGDLHRDCNIASAHSSGPLLPESETSTQHVFAASIAEVYPVKDKEPTALF